MPLSPTILNSGLTISVPPPCAPGNSTPLSGVPGSFNALKPCAVAATDVAILNPAAILLRAITGAAAKPLVAMACGVAKAAAFAACVDIIVFATPTAFSAIIAAACTFLLSLAKLATKFIPASTFAMSRVAYCGYCVGFRLCGGYFVFFVFFRTRFVVGVALLICGVFNFKVFVVNIVHVV